MINKFNKENHIDHHARMHPEKSKKLRDDLIAHIRKNGGHAEHPGTEIKHEDFSKTMKKFHADHIDNEMHLRRVKHHSKVH